MSSNEIEIGDRVRLSLTGFIKEDKKYLNSLLLVKDNGESWSFEGWDDLLKSFEIEKLTMELETETQIRASNELNKLTQELEVREFDYGVYLDPGTGELWRKSERTAHPWRNITNGGRFNEMQVKNLSYLIRLVPESTTSK